jgi:hypothetical protein
MPNITLNRNLNKQATGSAPAGILRAVTKVMRCLGILDEQAKGALSTLFVIASPSFERLDSGGYVVPYAKIGKPSDSAENAELAVQLWDWTRTELDQKGLLADTFKA